MQSINCPAVNVTTLPSSNVILTISLLALIAPLVWGIIEKLFNCNVDKYVSNVNFNASFISNVVSEYPSTNVSIAGPKTHRCICSSVISPIGPVTRKLSKLLIIILLVLLVAVSSVHLWTFDIPGTKPINFSVNTSLAPDNTPYIHESNKLLPSLIDWFLFVAKLFKNIKDKPTFCPIFAATSVPTPNEPNAPLVAKEAIIGGNIFPVDTPILKSVFNHSALFCPKKLLPSLILLANSNISASFFKSLITSYSDWLSSPW